MNYQSAIGYLYDLQKYGMKFGLDNISRLLSAAGSPQESFRSVHIAGTNGKGSTSAMIESILRTSGAKTGLFTSPHLVSFTERIRINGEEISEEEVVSLAGEVRQLAGGNEEFAPTFFEVVTAMAFLHFQKKGVDWAIVETGLGGRLDATNTILPEASVIAHIALDHREFLGNSLREVAGEKAGIIKQGVPVISAEQRAEALEVLIKKCGEKGAPFFCYGPDFHSQLSEEGLGGIRFHYKGEGELKDLALPLSGEHQMRNAAVAIRTIEELKRRHPALECDIRAGLASVRWPGRLELIRKDPPVLIDGAHNPDAASVLAGHMKKILAANYRRILLVVGIMGDKDLDGILAELLPCAGEIIGTAASYGRAASADIIAARAAFFGFHARKTGSVSEALALAEELYRPGDIIVVTGSFYTIGEAREILGAKGVLSRLRE